jgi:hypothetical protein
MIDDIVARTADLDVDLCSTGFSLCGFEFEESKEHRLKPVLPKIMWQSTMTWLARHARGRYVLLLEEEVSRLRAENRALVNSLLGTAGFPPISPEDDTRRGLVGLPPVRRRTWTQIARDRELAAGRGAAEK